MKNRGPAHGYQSESLAVNNWNELLKYYEKVRNLHEEG